MTGEGEEEEEEEEEERETDRMANMELKMGPQLEQIHGEIRDNFRALAYVCPLYLSLYVSIDRFMHQRKGICNAFRKELVVNLSPPPVF